MSCNFFYTFPRSSLLSPSCPAESLGRLPSDHGAAVAGIHADGEELLSGDYDGVVVARRWNSASGGDGVDLPSLVVG